MRGLWGANVEQQEMSKRDIPAKLAHAPVGPAPTAEQRETIRKYEERRAKGERGISEGEAKRRLEDHLRGRPGRVAPDR